MSEDATESLDIARLENYDSEFTRARSELEMRLPVALENATSETNRLLDIGLRERRPDNETKKWMAIFNSMASHAEAAHPGATKIIEELTFAIAKSFRHPDTDLTDIIDESCDVLEDIAQTRNLQPVIDMSPASTPEDRQNRKTLFRMALSQEQLAQNLNDLLTGSQENKSNAMSDMETEEVVTPQHIKQSGIGVGQRSIWGFMSGYAQVARVSVNYDAGEKAQALRQVVAELVKN